MKQSTKQELKYITYSGIFAFFWFVFALPFLVNKLDGQSPEFQFLVLNIGLYAFFFIFLKSIITSTSVNIKSSLGLLSLFLALDCWMPEFHVSMGGELIKGGLMGVGTTDYFFGTIANNLGLTWNIFGVSFIYIFTYIVMPVSLLLIASKLLPNMVKHL